MIPRWLLVIFFKVSCQIKQRAWTWFLPLSVPAQPCACAGWLRDAAVATCLLAHSAPVNSTGGCTQHHLLSPASGAGRAGGSVWCVGGRDFSAGRWFLWLEALPGSGANVQGHSEGSSVGQSWVLIRPSRVLIRPRLWVQTLYGPFILELDSLVLVGPFQLKMFCYSLISVLFRYLPLRAW